MTSFTVNTARTTDAVWETTSIAGVATTQVITKVIINAADTLQLRHGDDGCGEVFPAPF